MAVNGPPFTQAVNAYTWKSENENKVAVVNNCHIDTARLPLCLSK
jgi:hypothetical protein